MSGFAATVTTGRSGIVRAAAACAGAGVRSAGLDTPSLAVAREATTAGDTGDSSRAALVASASATPNADTDTSGMVTISPVERRMVTPGNLPPSRRSNAVPSAERLLLVTTISLVAARCAAESLDTLSSQLSIASGLRACGRERASRYLERQRVNHAGVRSRTHMTYCPAGRFRSHETALVPLLPASLHTMSRVHAPATDNIRLI